MRAGGNAKPIAVALSFAILIWVSAPESARAGEERISPAEAEVLVYGEEQALVDAMTKRSDSVADREYRNELDHAFAVLLARAYPKPEARRLARETMDSLCEEVEALGGARVPDSQRSRWVTTAVRAKSFDSVLEDMGAGDAGGAKREQLVAAGLRAMLRATGWKDASVLRGPEVERIMNLVQARGQASQERGMLGVKLDRWPAIEVLPGTPAAEAGLRDGDVVLRVNARNVGEIETTADALSALSGAAGTKVSLTVKRGNETLSFEARRLPFAAASVRARVVDPGVVYIRIPLFEGSGIAARVNELIREHVTDAVSDVILDLRDNPGGRPEEVNAVADVFLDEKHLQTFHFRDGKRITFKSKPGALDVQVTVLTNRNTGSGAEMLAIALHDNHRATVIGQPTAGALFGKDFEKLGDGRMIVFRSEPTILSPTGNDYSETGLPPDILVGESKAPGEDRILGLAIQRIRTRPKQDTARKPAP